MIALVAAGAWAATLAGCGEAAIEEHRVPRQPGTAQAPPAPSSAPSATNEQPWTAPDSWRAVPGERPMRLATYEVPDADGPVEVAITRFPGDVGGMLANINRWRDQIGLGPITEADVPAMLTAFENPGFHGATMLLEGPRQHMLAASIHEPAADRTWFVRVTASPAAAGRVRAEFEAFARSFGAGG